MWKLSLASKPQFLKISSVSDKANKSNWLHPSFTVWPSNLEHLPQLLGFPARWPPSLFCSPFQDSVYGGHWAQARFPRWYCKRGIGPSLDLTRLFWWLLLLSDNTTLCFHPVLMFLCKQFSIIKFHWSVTQVTSYFIIFYIFRYITELGKDFFKDQT